MRGPEEVTKTVRLGHSLQWMARNYKHVQGINLKVVTVPDLDNASDQVICKFIANALNPVYPRYKQDLESECEKYRVIEDNIKSCKDWKKVNPQKKASTETIIDSILEELEDSPLDHQIKRATQVQDAPGGKHLARIWGKPN